MAKRRSSDINTNVFGGKPVVNAANIQKGDASFSTPKGENEKKSKILANVHTVVQIIVGILTAAGLIIGLLTLSDSNINEKDLKEKIINGVFYEKSQ